MRAIAVGKSSLCGNCDRCVNKSLSVTQAGSGIRMQRPFSTLNRGETSGLSPPFIRQSVLLGLMGKNMPLSGPAIRSRTRSRLPPPLL